MTFTTEEPAGVEGGVAPVVPVILCGGAGTRLWPASRRGYPKPFIALLGERSSFVETVLRVRRPGLFAAPLVVGSEEHRFLIAEQLRLAGVGTSGGRAAGSATIVLEPEGRDSGPAIAAAAGLALAADPGAVVLVLAADHAVRDAAGFRATVEAALPAARGGRIVTFGIVPTGPSTAYGYVRPGMEEVSPGVHAVAGFREKPDAEAAAAYVAAGDLWNAGNFLARADVLLAELERHAPGIAGPVAEAVAGAARDLDFLRLKPSAFSRADKLSIDYAVMERTDRAAVIRAAFDWSDIGSWDALHALGAKDGAGNVFVGEVEARGARDCFADAGGRLVALVGVEGLAVVATEDAVLVVARDRAEEVKGLVEALRARGSKTVDGGVRSYRPWGHYQTLDLDTRHQVKRIVVKPGAKLSLQKHFHRAEHWVVVRGTAIVHVDGNETLLRENESVYIPLGAVHRLENPGSIPLDLIEVQSGSYLGEDDIVRLEDVYDRAARG